MSRLRIYGDRSREWCNSENEYHREEGPAVEYVDGSKEWWIKGKLHRLDGPALEGVNGTKYWWVNGESYSESEFKKVIQG